MEDLTAKVKNIFEGTYVGDEIEISEIVEMLKDENSSIEDIQEYIEDRINEIEIIYYDNAMKILSNNDSSLTTSLRLASDMGMELVNLNSETLATLLIQDVCRDELSRQIDEIAELLD